MASSNPSSCAHEMTDLRSSLENAASRLPFSLAWKKFQ
jgi:hypothetical protein